MLELKTILDFQVKSVTCSSVAHLFHFSGTNGALLCETLTTRNAYCTKPIEHFHRNTGQKKKQMCQGTKNVFLLTEIATRYLAAKTNSFAYGLEGMACQWEGMAHLVGLGFDFGPCLVHVQAKPLQQDLKNSGAHRTGSTPLI